MTLTEADALRARVQELEAFLAQPRIRVAVNAVCLSEDQVVLVEFQDESGLHYNFPGGGVEVGETLEEALRREVEEETCLAVSVERLLLIVESVGSRNTNLINGERRPWNEVRFFFLSSPADGSEARLPDRPDPHETAVRWFHLDALPGLLVLPQVADQLVQELRSPGSSPVIVPNPQA